jgi:hypothetical protein
VCLRRHGCAAPALPGRARRARSSSPKLRVITVIEHGAAIMASLSALMRGSPGIVPASAASAIVPPKEWLTMAWMGAKGMRHGRQAGNADRNVEFAAGGLAVSRQIIGHDAEARCQQWRDEGCHEGGLPGPAMDEDHGRARLGTFGCVGRLEQIGRNGAAGEGHRNLLRVRQPGRRGVDRASLFGISP